jgi:hypothetical protein
VFIMRGISAGTQCSFFSADDGGGRAVAQAVGHWRLTAGARVRSQVSPCGMCGGQNGTGQIVHRVFGFPAASQHSTTAPYSSITAP